MGLLHRDCRIRLYNANEAYIQEGLNLYIAIDGPAGAGKSTVARELARRLKIKYLDSGAMYRAITLKILQNGTDLENEEALKSLLDNTQIEITGEEDTSRIFLDGKEVTEEIRSGAVNGYVSQVSAVPPVRKAMVARQQELAREWGAVVMDGRDIGTCVLPDAALKIYLDASPEERAKRRWKENREKGREMTTEEVQKEIAMRDAIDSSREVSPLQVAAGAFVLDTTDMNKEEVVDKIASYAKKVGS